MSNKIIKNRLQAVQAQLHKKGIDCLIITKPANVTYTTGFSGEDSWAVITPRQIYLLTDSRYIEQAQNQCPQVRVIQYSGNKAAHKPISITKAVAKLIGKLKSVRTVAIENSSYLSDFIALKKDVKTCLGKHKTSTLKVATNIIEQLRIIKQVDEIAAIKTACQIAAKALKKTILYIKPGTTENELAGMLDFQIRKEKAQASFDTIVAFGANASRPHHKPTNRKLKQNDTILIDFGVKYKNYCCDLTRIFTVGKTSAFYKKVCAAVKQAAATAIKMIKPGVEIKQVDIAAREVIKKHGFSVYGHGTGHGLGLEVHEQPTITGNNKEKLCAGMVFTIEPAVYIPGKLGIRIEDDILVTNNGCEILTKDCPHYISLSAGSCSGHKKQNIKD